MPCCILHKCVHGLSVIAEFLVGGLFCVGQL